MTALAAVAAYLPDKPTPIEELADVLRLRSSQVKLYERYLGLGEVRWDPDASAVDLLLCAADRLTELRGNEHRVRYVVFARSMPVAVPYPMNVLHDACDRLGLGHAVAFTVTQQACATGLLGIDVAGRLLAAAPDDPDALALVLSGEKTFTRDAQIVPDTCVFGEAAAACLVSHDGPRDRLRSFATSSRGEFDGRVAESPELGRLFSQAYPDALAEAIGAAVTRAGLSLADVHLILPHNVNAVSWRKVCRQLDYPLASVVLDNMAVTGHSFCSDGLVNYCTARERGLLEPGRPYVMAAVGLGATFSAMVFEH
jgi:3-oxoacyl-[acyl-carrier-protein] synthase-3